jgi:hypothetical protein
MPLFGKKDEKKKETKIPEEKITATSPLPEFMVKSDASVLATPSSAKIDETESKDTADDIGIVHEEGNAEKASFIVEQVKGDKMGELVPPAWELEIANEGREVKIWPYGSKVPYEEGQPIKIVEDNVAGCPHLMRGVKAWKNLEGVVKCLDCHNKEMGES